MTLGSGIRLRGRRADVLGPRRSARCGMEIGDLVTYQDRTFVLRGFDPTGVPDRRADLEDVVTGECVSALFVFVVPAEPPAEDPGEGLS